MKKKLLISFSGGRTSAFMTKYILENKADDYDTIVVFANTGKEREETLEFVRDCDLYFGFNTVWIEAVTNPVHKKGVTAKVVSFDTASRAGEPFEAMIQKHGIPNPAEPHCTRELKKYAIRAYARSIGWKDYKTAIGIRIDEAGRVSKERQKEKLVYPLIEWIPITKIDINRFWSEQKFDLILKSYEGNCDCCWKKSFRKLYTLAKEKPEMFEWWEKMEKKYENFIPVTKVKMQGQTKRFFRTKKTVADILEESKEAFEMATDDSKVVDAHSRLTHVVKDKLDYRDLYKIADSVDLGIEETCSESCEVF